MSYIHIHVIFTSVNINKQIIEDLMVTQPYWFRIDHVIFTS